MDAFREDLTQAPDRRQIVMHRLVEAVDRDAATQVVDSYIEAYRPVDSHVGIGDYSRYREEMLGHADLATTSIYLHVCAPHLQAAVALHPLSG